MSERSTTESGTINAHRAMCHHTSDAFGCQNCGGRQLDRCRGRGNYGIAVVENGRSPYLVDDVAYVFCKEEVDGLKVNNKIGGVATCVPELELIYRHAHGYRP